MGSCTDNVGAMIIDLEMEKKMENKVTRHEKNVYIQGCPMVALEQISRSAELRICSEAVSHTRHYAQIPYLLQEN